MRSVGISQWILQEAPQFKYSKKRIESKLRRRAEGKYSVFGVGGYLVFRVQFFENGLITNILNV